MLHGEPTAIRILFDGVVAGGGWGGMGWDGNGGWRTSMAEEGQPSGYRLEAGRIVAGVGYLGRTCLSQTDVSPQSVQDPPKQLRSHASGSCRYN